MTGSQRKYLIWDFDGTLGWRPGGWTSAVITVLRQSAPSITVTPEEVRHYLQSGFPWHAPENAHPGLSSNEWWDDLQPVFARAFRALGIQNGETYTLARQVRQAYLDPHAWQRYNDVLPALEVLSARGWKHILLSNHVPELPILMEQMGLTSYFIAQFNSAQTGYEKPNPKAFRAVLDWTGAEASAWVIGDSFASDILGAQEVGLPAILVRKPHPDAPIYCATLNDLHTRL